MHQFLNIRPLIISTLIALASAQVIAGAEHDLTPKFGGVVVETKIGDIEIVVKSDVMQIYINDHGKAVKLDGGKARITLLNGADKSEADLVPASGKLEAKGAFKVAKGTKGIAVVTLVGLPPTSARFEVK